MRDEKLFNKIKNILDVNTKKNWYSRNDECTGIFKRVDFSYRKTVGELFKLVYSEALNRNKKESGNGAASMI